VLTAVAAQFGIGIGGLTALYIVVSTLAKEFQFKLLVNKRVAYWISNARYGLPYHPILNSQNRYLRSISHLQLEGYHRTEIFKMVMTELVMAVQRYAAKMVVKDYKFVTEVVADDFEAIILEFEAKVKEGLKVMYGKQNDNGRADGDVIYNILYEEGIRESLRVPLNMVTKTIETTKNSKTVDDQKVYSVLTVLSALLDSMFAGTEKSFNSLNGRLTSISDKYN
jgi:hypothetical protein